MDRITVAKFFAVLAMLSGTFGLAGVAVERIFSRLVHISPISLRPDWTTRVFTSPAPYFAVLAVALLCDISAQAWRHEIRFGRVSIERSADALKYWLILGAEIVTVGLIARLAILAFVSLSTQS